MPQISLASARINAGLTQSEVAEILGCTPKTIGSYENGRTPIPLVTFVKLAKIYDISTDFIKIPVVDDGKHDEEM